MFTYTFTKKINRRRVNTPYMDPVGRVFRWFLPSEKKSCQSEYLFWLKLRNVLRPWNLTYQKWRCLRVNYTFSNLSVRGLKHHLGFWIFSPTPKLFKIDRNEENPPTNDVVVGRKKNFHPDLANPHALHVGDLSKHFPANLATFCANIFIHFYTCFFG